MRTILGWVLEDGGGGGGGVPPEKAILHITWENVQFIPSVKSKSTDLKHIKRLYKNVKWSRTTLSSVQETFLEEIWISAVAHPYSIPGRVFPPPPPY